MTTPSNSTLSICSLPSNALTASSGINTLKTHTVSTNLDGSRAGSNVQEAWEDSVCFEDFSAFGFGQLLGSGITVGQQPSSHRETGETYGSRSSLVLQVTYGNW